MSILRSLAGLLAAIVCAAPAFGQGSGADWKSPDGLVSAFLQLTTHSDYSRREHPIRKWVGSIRYGTVHRGGEVALYDNLIDVHMQHVAQLTGMDVRRTTQLADANFVVVMTDDEHLAEDMQVFAGADTQGQRDLAFRNNMCWASLRSDSRGAIRHAVAVIPVDTAHSSGQLVACVAEELTHLMGFTNDTRAPLPSIFSHGTVRSVLGGFDTLMLRLLYDERVRPGMKADALRSVLYAIAAEYQRSGDFEKAERLAGQSGLAGLCQ